MDKMYGYVGNIARINLTTGEVTNIPTSDYVPKYLGGRGICNKIFWDEVGPGVKAFDPENKFIFMTGPTTGTGIPTGGRTVIAGIAPQCNPEQYSWSGIGGWFGAELKYAGYDGFMLEGKAEKPSYIWIDDGKIEILDAADLWGTMTYAAQVKLAAKHGRNVQSLVIGPAGENLLRMAIVATANESAAAKGGFGAVLGSKKIKAITVRGTKSVRVADPAGVLSMRKKVGKPLQMKNPVVAPPHFAQANINFPVEGGVPQFSHACSHGCNQRCAKVYVDVKSAFDPQDERSAFGEGKMNQVSKCVGPFAMEWVNDCFWLPMQYYHTGKYDLGINDIISGALAKIDMSDPVARDLLTPHPGDRMNLWEANYEHGMMINEMCSQYGLNKWDIIIWLMTWLAMGKKEGVFDDLDLGMEIDVTSTEFMKYLLDMIVYRKGYYGNLFAEGLSRTIRTLGKEKYGDTVYTGRWQEGKNGLRLDIPISLESAWGYSAHWNGRGYQGSLTQDMWLCNAVVVMTSTRDAISNTHPHTRYEEALEMKKDPYDSPIGPEIIVYNERASELKEAITLCDWQFPSVFWPTAEAEIYETVTGIKVSKEDLNEAADRLKNLFRAILIRNYHRTREMEVSEVIPFHSYPDSDNISIDVDGFNRLVDNYYTLRNWDLQTGWPTRATYEKLGLKEVADELEKLGKLPE